MPATRRSLLHGSWTEIINLCLWTGSATSDRYDLPSISPMIPRAIGGDFPLLLDGVFGTIIQLLSFRCCTTASTMLVQGIQF